jgi:serralysin
MTGGAGNDLFLDNAFGTAATNDSMAGGLGDDAYSVDSAGDIVTELANQGIDTVDATVSVTLCANVEILYLWGSLAINGTGNALDNAITGSDGTNILNGAGGNDTMLGGAGADTFLAGAGKDLMTGGGGLDHFNFTALSDSGTAFATRDVINTFAHGDKVDVSAIDANSAVAGNQAFTFVDNFTHVAGQLEWTQTAPTGYLIQGDTNGDGAADFSLQIYAAPGFGTIHGWDFML